ncbi:MAG: acetate--CoA ligase family protein [Candidatus Eremiobacteraeota bacterium]|nr:acetate--CoA ligase family protein [Candidatus Eremiobacteraeota bacterium]
MNVPEHYAKEILREGGIATPRGRVARTADDASAVARELGGRVAIKAQVPAGKRGKSGGIAFAASPHEAREKAAALLGTSIAGYVVEAVLVEEAVEIARELYAAILNDGASRSPLVLFADEGGIEIEELHARAPDSVRTATVDIRRGLDPERAARLARHPGVADVLLRMYERFATLDCELLEINPLAIDRKGDLVALDCKLALDDSARPRHETLFAEVERLVGPQGTELERRARAAGLYYIELGGNVGVLANGAGLTMTTIDAIAHAGGAPANFLEIGGEAYTKATAALELVLANPRVESVLVNFCGAFARTDVMAEGVVAGYEALRPRVPFFFSIHGTGEERANAIVRARLGARPHAVMEDAVRAAVAAAAAIRA